MSGLVVLAVDTATPQVGVALWDGGPVGSSHLIEGRRHGEVLAPAIDALLRSAGVTLDRVDLLAVDVGPGLFTGLRVGLATVAALASALGIPAVGVASTDVLAAAAAHAGRPVAAVVDIRRGEVAWSLHEGDVEVRPARVATPGELAVALADSGALAVGDGALRYAEVLGDVAGVEVAGPLLAYPSAVVLASVGAGRRHAAGPAGALAPRYLREADVRIGWQEAPARG